MPDKAPPDPAPPARAFTPQNPLNQPGLTTDSATKETLERRSQWPWPWPELVVVQAKQALFEAMFCTAVASRPVALLST